jgi:hypothetical protein
MDTELFIVLSIWATAFCYALIKISRSIEKLVDAIKDKKY